MGRPSPCASRVTAATRFSTGVRLVRREPLSVDQSGYSSARSSSAFRGLSTKLAEIASRLIFRSSSTVKPRCLWAIKYSRFKSVLNIAGSSVLIVIGTPASKRRRMGCFASDATIPVRTLLVILMSRGIRWAARCLTRVSSSTLRTPCPIRSALSSFKAPHTLSGPAASPA